MKKSILLVDDDKITNLVNTHAARSVPFIENIYTASDGAEALRMFSSSAVRPLPDIVVLDLQMPLMGGFEFLQSFQHLDFPGKKKIVFIIVTSSDDTSDKIRAKSFGIKHFLTKPVSIEELRSILMEELEEKLKT